MFSLATAHAGERNHIRTSVYPIDRRMADGDVIETRNAHHTSTFSLTRRVDHPFSMPKRTSHPCRASRMILAPQRCAHDLFSHPLARG